MAGKYTVRMRRGSFVLGSSMVAIGAAFASPAAAQCAPDPTEAGGTTTCAGIDTDGVFISTPGTTLNVVAGASVERQVSIAIPTLDSWSVQSATVNVQGRVDGLDAAGILAVPNDRVSQYSSEGMAVSINIGADGIVTGTNGIATYISNGSSPVSRILLSIDNAGTITGTSGPAVIGDSGTLGTSISLVNRQGGSIGAIRGPIAVLDNAGTIDGGALSAVDAANTGGPLYGQKSNSGVIRSSSTDATLRNLVPDFWFFENSGVVVNTGTGAAMSATDVRLQNAAGGIVTGGTNGVALEAAATVNVVNAGRIEGSIVAGPARSNSNQSVIDSIDGVIDGDVILSATDDRLIARYTGSRQLHTGITGAIDGGGGANVVEVRVVADTVIDGPIDLLTNFQQLGFDVAAGSRVTLGEGFVAPGTLVMAGAGALDNRGTIEVAEQALLASNAWNSTITNAGTIRTTRVDGAGHAASTSGSFINTGTITAGGDGLSASASVANSGTIVARRTGVTGRGSFVNSGTIRSTDGVGLQLSNGDWQVSQNSGLIEGRLAGVSLSGSLTNSGTIQSAGTGVVLNSTATIVNLAGGIITGGTQAMGVVQEPFTYYNVTVRNAGTINGDVNIASTRLYDSARYHADDGGVLNGNLTLGSGDLLVTNLVNTGPGQFAGITGTVAASDTDLLYRVTADAQAVHATPAGFRSPSYDIAEGAELVLTGTTAQTLVLRGAGSADIDVDIATVGKELLDLAQYNAIVGPTMPPALTVVSRGDLTMERDIGDYTHAYTAVLLTGQTFTNAGAITVRQAGTLSPFYSETRPAAIGTSFDKQGTVINDGTINLAGAIGVYNVTSLTNTGSIVQVADTVASTGARQVDRVTNSGTISTDGLAVQDIRSLQNLSGGTIASASGTAIRSMSGHVTNAGTISGTVDLGYAARYDGAPTRSYGTGSYVAAGGTVDGHVLFGNAADLFVQMGERTGVSGIVDGAEGDDILQFRRDADATVALELPAGVVNFERFAVEAAAAGATVTVTGSGEVAGDLRVGGTGTVVNLATIAGAITTWPEYNFYDPAAQIVTSMAELHNSGTVRGGVRGNIASFTNDGTVEIPSGNPYWWDPFTVDLYADTAITVTNGGTITGGTVIGSMSSAVALAGAGGASVVNTGIITGDVVFNSYQGPGTNRFENRGTVAGIVWMGTGENVFVQGGGAQLEQAIGGSGSNLFVMDADAAGMINAGQLYRFDRLMQTGTEAITYLGAFDVPTVELAGGTLVVETGGALGTTGPITVTSGDAGVTVVNRGWIVGGVQFGAGDDTYVEGTGSSVGFVDGGAGGNTYGVLLAGDRQDIGARSGFQRLAVEGPGTLSLTPDQDFAEVALTGASLNLATSAFDVGAITGSDLAEQVVLGGDIAAVGLGGGDDMLTLSVAEPAGRYDGGAGLDLLRLDNPGMTVLRGSVTGFETVAIAAEVLNVGGTLGRTGDTTRLDGDVRQLLLADGGTIGGKVDLGAGDNLFTMSANGVLTGIVAGGVGFDTARFDLAQTLTLTGSLTGFEVLETRGAGALTLSGNAYRFDRLDLANDLTIAADASLAAERVSLGAGATGMTIAGRFAGSVSGAGTGQVVRVSGNSRTASAAFAGMDNIAALQIDGGWSTVAGTAVVGAITMTGGTLTGLAGSTIAADRVAVGRGAVFGSAGTVRADIAVDGTLSPGASPGTLTVLGDVSLASTSLALFEIGADGSDLLAIDGRLTIAPGATLELVAGQRVLPGQSLDLITSTRGIDGSFTNVVRRGDLFGFVVQDADRITLKGQFMDDPAFDPQVRGSIAYVNDLLTGGTASPALLAAVPLLVDAQGGTDSSGFAQIAPQPYATASQISVEQGLELARVGRNGGLAAPQDDATGPYTFAMALGRAGEIGGTDGIARARSDSYGALGGIGWANAGLSLGAFVGWTDNRQTLRSLAARTDAEGVIAGINARWRSPDGIGVMATVAYDSASAATTRAVAGESASGHYDLTAWTGDIAVDYDVPLANGWKLRPALGATLIRVRGDGVTESGNSPFALIVAERRQDWAFVDGTLDLRGNGGTRLRPWLSAGVRYRIHGTGPRALAALGGGEATLLANGAARADLTTILALGADMTLSRGVTLFSTMNGEAGTDVSHGGAQAGVKIAF